MELQVKSFPRAINFSSVASVSDTLLASPVATLQAFLRAFGQPYGGQKSRLQEKVEEVRAIIRLGDCDPECVDAALWRSRLQEERELELAQRVALTVWTMFAVSWFGVPGRGNKESWWRRGDRMPLPNMWFRN